MFSKNKGKVALFLINLSNIFLCLIMLANILWYRVQ